MKVSNFLTNLMVITMNQLSKRTVRLIPEMKIVLPSPQEVTKAKKVGRVLLAYYQPLALTALLVLAGFASFKRQERPAITEAQSVVEAPKDLTPWGDEITQDEETKAKYKPKNDAAPVSGSELFAQEARAYIEKFAPVARKEQAVYGIPASISLAQGLIESRAGTSKLAKGNNNHFGMKCFSRKCGKGHCSNFTDDTHKDFFRKYANAWESWSDHSRMLSKGRYAKLKKYGSNYRQWAYGLKSIGYATDRTYAEKLIGVIERYKLHEYDR